MLRVSSAHTVSHLRIKAVPAMMPLLPQALDASFVELGFAIGVFSILTALMQAPLGFEADNHGSSVRTALWLPLSQLQARCTMWA